MVQLEHLRAKTGELLDEAARGGLLTVTEHRWRRENLAQAQSVAELDALVHDLMDAPDAALERGAAVQSVPLVNLLSERVYSSADLGRRAEVTTVMGTTKVDLQGWNRTDELNLEVVTVMGETVVEVPYGCTVRVEVTPVMGECRVAPGVSGSGALIRITGTVVLGSLRVNSGRQLTV